MSKYDTAMMTTAFTFSQQSYCNRLKVGAVLSRDGRILATSYNGTIAGMSNCCEDSSGSTSDFTLHAEQNLITFCAKNGIPTNGTTIYITHSPCKQCSKLIAQSGITEVIYSTVYRDTDGLDFLHACNITTRRISNE
jgi:dCMP deaminase